MPCGLLLFVGLLSLFYRELPKLGVCIKISTGIVLAVRLKIFAASTWMPGTRLGSFILVKGRGSQN